jgi:hypothetical protein
LGALTLGAHRLIVVTSFWCISRFISMECPLSHLINVGLKPTLSKISIATPACFQDHWLGIFFPAFHFQPLLISVSEVGLL